MRSDLARIRAARDRLHDNEQSLVHQVEDLQLQLDDAHRAAESARVQIESITEHVMAATAVSERVNELESERVMLIGQIKQANTSINEERARANKTYEMLTMAQSEISRLTAERNRFNAELSEAKAGQESMLGSMKALQVNASSHIQSLETALQEANTKPSFTRSNSESASKVALLNEQIELQKSTIDDLMARLSEAEDHLNDERAAHTAAIDAIRREKIDLIGELDKVKYDLQSAQTEHQKELKKAQEALAKYSLTKSDELARVTADRDSLTLKLNDAANTHAENIDAITKAKEQEIAAATAEFKSKIDELHNHVKQLTDQLSVARDAQSGTTSLPGHVKELEDSVSAYSNKIKSLETELAAQTSVITQLHGEKTALSEQLVNMTTEHAAHQAAHDQEIIELKSTNSAEVAMLASEWESRQQAVITANAELSLKVRNLSAEAEQQQSTVAQLKSKLSVCETELQNVRAELLIAQSDLANSAITTSSISAGSIQASQALLSQLKQQFSSLRGELQARVESIRYDCETIKETALARIARILTHSIAIPSPADLNAEIAALRSQQEDAIAKRDLAVRELENYKASQLLAMKMAGPFNQPLLQSVDVLSQRPVDAEFLNMENSAMGEEITQLTVDNKALYDKASTLEKALVEARALHDDSVARCSQVTFRATAIQLFTLRRF